MILGGNKVKIYIADYAGFCFGVKRAIEITEETLSRCNTGEEVFSIGPLVHNPQVVDYFNKKGLKVVENINEINQGKFIIRSHGISGILQKKLEDLGVELIDCTCPYVKSVHNKAKNFHEKGYKIVIIGDKNHPEVIGINGWCNDVGIIINTEEEANSIPNFDKICILSQTTNTQEKFNKLADIISKKGKEVKIFNTICNATNQRQTACEELAKKVEAMIVIGGYNSSNTNKLVEISKRYCQNVYHIETYMELSLQEITKYNTIGITAGASTPDWIIKEVVDKLENITNDNIMEAIERSLKRISRGEIVKGKIIGISEDEIIVNINYKSDGIIPKEEISNDPAFNHKSAFKIGDEIEVYILKLDDGEGNVILSRKKVESIKSWDNLKKIYENNQIVECKVIDIVKSGLSVLVDEINGFIPVSQISTKYVDDLYKYKNKTLKAKIIELDRSKKRIVLSSKEAEKELITKKREKLWNSLKVGEIIEGEVKKIVDFGVFVDIGGLDGLIHISDLSWQRVEHPSHLLKNGDKIKVQILDLDKNKNRIALGLKQIQPKPWDIFMQNKKVGDVITGKIVKILNYGAFLKLEEGVEGLVHISQISTEHIKNPSEKLKVGDVVQAKIINIDEKEKKIGLSLKAIEEEKNKLVENAIVEKYNNESFNVTIGDLIKKQQ